MSDNPAAPTCFAYMLRCADGSVYAGWTNDLEARLAAHNDGSGSKYTRSRRPVALAYCEPFPSKAEAMRREAQLKRLTRSQKLALIGAARISGGPISES